VPRHGDESQLSEQAAERGRIGPMELNIPAIKGIGDSLIYLVDRYGPAGSIYDVDFVPIAGVDPAPRGAGLVGIDHLTHNVHRGRMVEWAEFYQRLFNFREIRYFDIEGRLTGLKSKAMTSPCGKIRIPINESADDRSQIAEYLAAYHGEGIQHIALSSGDILASVEALRGRGVADRGALDDVAPADDEALARLAQSLAHLREEVSHGPVR
jgi:4-hydroxyphenylpyruvate dioxygenase